MISNKFFLIFLLLLKGINTFKVSNNQLDCVNGTEKMSHGDALNFLSVNSIQLNSYGACANRFNGKCTSLDQINCYSICFITKLKNQSNCKIIITAGTEEGHSNVEKSHWNGFKLNINLDMCTYLYITRNFRFLEFNFPNGAPKYVDGLGNEYELGGNHWSITISRCI